MILWNMEQCPICARVVAQLSIANREPLFEVDYLDKF